jgi:hypothetical protein
MHTMRYDAIRYDEKMVGQTIPCTAEKDFFGVKMRLFHMMFCARGNGVDQYW